jgi:hypothetical protein
VEHEGRMGITVDKFAGLGTLEGGAEPRGDETGASLELGSEGGDGGAGVAFLGAGLPGEPGDFGDFGHFQC